MCISTDSTRKHKAQPELLGNSCVVVEELADLTPEELELWHRLRKEKHRAIAQRRIAADIRSRIIRAQRTRPVQE